MNLYDVYPLFDINIVRGKGCHVWDDKGQKYLDLYGGHAVISIGHSHPHYVQKMQDQVALLGFYSNSVVNSLQRELAVRLGKVSGYDDKCPQAGLVPHRTQPRARCREGFSRPYLAGR